MSYTELRSANVDGTREVVQLAARRRRKPLHYVSTMFTLNPSRDGTVDTPFDEDRRAGWQGLENGYVQTKWVAERMVLDAAELGLDVSVHRMDFVVGDTRSGKLHDTDFLVRLFQDILGRRELPRERAELSIVPVDQLAAEMVALMPAPIEHHRRQDGGGQRERVREGAPVPVDGLQDEGRTIRRHDERDDPEQGEAAELEPGASVGPGGEERRPEVDQAHAGEDGVGHTEPR